MAAIWSALPGTAPVAKCKDRKTAVQRLWAAFGQLPVASAPAGGSAGPRAGSKQARVIGLLQRAKGSDERRDRQRNGVAAPHGARADLRSAEEEARAARSIGGNGSRPV